MTATTTESRHFTWHCAVATLLMQLPGNAATSSNFRHAIRRATDSATGKKGVLYASKEARKIQEVAGKNWDECGLVREHVIPVSEVCKRVLHELSILRVEEKTGGTTGELADLTNLLTKGDLGAIRTDSRVRQVEQIVRKWTLLAWISDAEHRRLAKDGLQKCMPNDWDGQEKFARYRDCGIELSEIRQISLSVV